MRVTFIGPAWPYRGGIATIIERLAREFQSGWTSESGVRVPPSEVRVLTFRVQYPSWLFPGRTQFRTGPKPADISIERRINTINPLNWLAVGRRIARESAPDSARQTTSPLVVLKYWTPFMAPCFGAIARVARCTARRDARRARRRGLTPTPPPRFVVQLDNVVPHERHWWDGLLTRFFVRSMDGFVAMSGEVAQQLNEFLPAAPAANPSPVTKPSSSAKPLFSVKPAPDANPSSSAKPAPEKIDSPDASASIEWSLPARPRRSVAPRVVLSPHPLFDHFGARLPRAEACARLGLDPKQKYAMFFGLVREYKGLDLLLEAWAGLAAATKNAPATVSENIPVAPKNVPAAVPENVPTTASEAVSPPHLLVVGEFYDSPEKYDPARWGLSAADVTVHPSFVPDDEVGLWFSAADVLILPYRSATQSGVTQIAYHFDVPMIVTDVGGLPEIVRNDTVGFVAPPTAAGLRNAIEKIFDLRPATPAIEAAPATPAPPTAPATPASPAVEVAAAIPASTTTGVAAATPATLAAPATPTAPATPAIEAAATPKIPTGGGTLDRLRANFSAEKRRFSWSAAADALLRAADLPND